MNFKTATDLLGQAITHHELADKLGVHVQRIRQARLDPNADGYRKPPEAWASAVIELARNRGGELAKLADELEAENGS